jgi:hypothetical protein
LISQIAVQITIFAIARAMIQMIPCFPPPILPGPRATIHSAIAFTSTAIVNGLEILCAMYWQESTAQQFEHLVEVSIAMPRQTIAVVGAECSIER